MSASNERMFPLIPNDRRNAAPGPLSIPWSVAEKAYGVYASRYGRGQSLERLAERGGFGVNEMDDMYPQWRDEVSEIAELRDQLRRCQEWVSLLPPLDLNHPKQSPREVQLEAAIRTHRDQHGDDRCWIDDQTLYAVLADGNLGDNTVGDPEAMRRNCDRFIANRCQAGGDWPSYAELEQCIRDIDKTLRVPAAEYVPAIGDVFAIIDKVLKENPKP